MEKKYHIPDFYKWAETFYPDNFQTFEGERKILSEENKNYSKMQNIFPEEIGETIQYLYEKDGQINNYILSTYIHSYIKVNNKEIIDIIHNPNFGKDFKITSDITYDKYIVEKEMANEKLEKIKQKSNI